MYSKSALAIFGLGAYFPIFNLAMLIKGPSGWDNIEAVPNLTKRPDVDETGLAVLAVRGVERAVRKASGRPPAEVPGRDTPLIGLPIIRMRVSYGFLINVKGYLVKKMLYYKDIYLIS